MTVFDVPRLRKEFPTLGREIHDGRRLVFLDSAASSQTPRPVLEAMATYYEQLRSNVERGIYAISEEATSRYERARTSLAEFVGAPEAEGIVFTKNVTEAINLVAYSWVRRRLGPGDALLTTEMEHHANFVPWWHAAQDEGFDLRVIPVTDDYRLDLEAAEELLADGRVRFLAVGHVSNVLGTINPVTELARMAREANADCRVLVDGAQAAPHLPLDVGALGVDFYGLTGHKMCGPTGIGALVTSSELLEEMPPFLTGGSMIREVSVEEVTWNEPPHKFEAGTPMIAEAFGLDAACRYLSDLGMDQVRAHELELLPEFLDALEAVEGLELYGPVDPGARSSAISFTLGDIHPHDVGAVLDRHGVCVRVGHHCAKPLMQHLGLNATVRVSLHVYNDTDDIPPLIEGLEHAKEFFAR